MIIEGVTLHESAKKNESDINYNKNMTKFINKRKKRTTLNNNKSMDNLNVKKNKTFYVIDTKNLNIKIHVGPNKLDVMSLRVDNGLKPNDLYKYEDVENLQDKYVKFI